MVGLIPLFAVETLEPEVLATGCPGFDGAWSGSSSTGPISTANVACMRTPGRGERRLLSVVDADRLRRVLHVHARRAEFLSPYGIRALSRVHRDQPYRARVDGAGASRRLRAGRVVHGLFGGNSNWRGPVWFPVNYLLIESLQKFHHYLGDGFKVECPDRLGPA